jgi:hypothetical protein
MGLDILFLLVGCLHMSFKNFVLIEYQNMLVVCAKLTVGES